MSNDPLTDPNLDESDRAYAEMQKLFEDMSFRERMRRMFTGLRMPKDSGEYKFARLQMQRLSGPIAAFLIPLIGIIIMLCLPKSDPPKQRTFTVENVEVEEAPDIEEPPPPDEPPPTDFDPVDTEFDGPIGDPEITDTVAEFTDQPISPKPAEMNTVAQVVSPIQLTGIVGSRSPGSRGAALSKYGGTQGGEATVMRALRWLKMNQNSDGSWGTGGYTTAMTSMALLTYLAHGETPGPEHPEFGETVERGIRYLMDEQNKESGYFRHKDGNNYSHPIAVYALSEAYSMTMNPLIKETAEAACRPLISGQNAYNGWEYGMWRTERTDTSFSGWCVQAIKAAHTAGLEVPGLDACYEKAKKAFLPCYQGTSGAFCYQAESGVRPNGHPAETPIATLCMQMLGEYNASEVKASMRYMNSCTYDFAHWEDQPWNGGGGGGNNPSPVYYWYYLTQAKFQEGDGTFWGWNAKFAPELQRRQVKISKGQSGYKDHDGTPHEIGFWDSPSATESYRGSLNQGDLPCKRWSGGKETESTTTLTARVMDTCLCALQLMVYYRYGLVSQTPDTRPRLIAAPSGSNEEVFAVQQAVLRMKPVLDSCDNDAFLRELEQIKNTLSTPEGRAEVLRYEKMARHCESLQNWIVDDLKKHGELPRGYRGVWDVVGVDQTGKNIVLRNKPFVRIADLRIQDWVCFCRLLLEARPTERTSLPDEQKADLLLDAAVFSHLHGAPDTYVQGLLGQAIALRPAIKDTVKQLLPEAL